MKSIKHVILCLALVSTLCASAEVSKPKAGVNPANLNTAVSPGSDFYDYACGGWIKANPMADEYSSWGTFDVIAENNRKQLKDLFTELSTSNQTQGSIGQKVKDLYLLGMDSIRLNKEGGTSIQADLAKIQNMKRGDLTKMIADQHAGIGSPFFGTGVMADAKNSSVNAFYMEQPSLGLPDRDYYINNDLNTKNIRAQYVKYIETIFTLSGYSTTQAKQAAKNILKIETEMANANWDRTRLRDLTKQYNIRTVTDLEKDYPNINWAQYFSGISLPQLDKVILMQPDVMAKINAMIPKLTDQEIKDYLAFNYISEASSYLSDAFNKANFEMYSKTLQGKKEMTPRWKRALGVPNNLLGEGVGELYVNKYFAKGSKEKMMKLVNNLRMSLGEHIANNSWMSDSTKINALVKLNSFTVKIGYPDKWRDYSAITIDPSQTYWANVKKGVEFEANRHYQKWGKPVDKDEWGMTPQTVNAYYNPLANEIVFPAGILQAPFFDVNADDASNYGAIGVVIGHEMTHGFDDQGRNFDQNGNMKDWWKAEDSKKFDALANVLVAQYDSIIVVGDTHANGRFTLGENIADHGGLNIAYTAFKKTPQGQSEVLIDGFTPDQRFYLSYASAWAENMRDEEKLRLTKTDPHSLGRWRTDAALKNIAPFYKAFNIKPGDAMYIAPDKRVTIW